jgi:hypothetical protein
VRKHPTDAVSLVFGAIFLGIAGLWALVVGQQLDATGLRVGVPVLLIGAGVVGVLTSLGGARRRPAAAGAPPPPGATPPAG